MTRTSSGILKWAPCQNTWLIRSVLGLVGPVSVYCDRCDLQLLSQCRRTWNCLSRSVPECTLSVIYIYVQSAALGHRNDGWRHGVPTYICYTDNNRCTTNRRQVIKVVTQAAKFKRLQDHPMLERMNQSTRGRLGRSNFIQYSRIFERKNPELPDHITKPIPSVKTVPFCKREQLQEYALTCQGSQTEAFNQSQRGVCQSQVSRRQVDPCLHRRF